MVTDEQITWAYRLFLDREPETKNVIARFRRLKDTEHLRYTFTSCAEFRAKNRRNLPAYLPIDAPPISVEWRIDAEASEALLSRIEEVWNRLGRERPHWSVLSSDQFLPERIESTREAFFASGANDVRLILATLQRLGRRASEFPEVFEFGCGLARVTTHLARQFERVTSCDVSPSHLEQAESVITESGATNIRLTRAGIPHFGMTQPFDLWFSRIVLQHNSPPLMAMILRSALHLLRAGGLAIFQLPTYALGYRFSIEEYLANPPPAHSFEMHALPQQAVLEIADECDCTAQEIREDNSAGNPNWISNWIVLRKKFCSGQSAEAESRILSESAKRYWPDISAAYDVFRRILGDQIPENVGNWADLRTKRREELSAQGGHILLDVKIDPNEFTSHCRAANRAPSREALETFASEKARRVHRNMRPGLTDL